MKNIKFKISLIMTLMVTGMGIVDAAINPPPDNIYVCGHNNKLIMLNWKKYKLGNKYLTNFFQYRQCPHSYYEPNITWGACDVIPKEKYYCTGTRTPRDDIDYVPRPAPPSPGRPGRIEEAPRSPSSTQ